MRLSWLPRRNLFTACWWCSWLLVALSFAGLTPSALALKTGDRVQANQNVNVRSAPAGPLIGSRATGDQGSLVDGPVTATLSGTTYEWWRIDWDTGVDGWCFDGGISPLPEDGAALLYGVDVSHYQGTINWTEVAGAGKDFAFCKSTEGVSYLDETFARNMSAGRAAGVIMGTYHFARPASNPAVEEARFFVKTAAPFLLPQNLVPVLDLESGSTLGKAALSQWTRDWCQEVERLTTLRPIIYTGRDYARNYAETSLNQWPLWIAVPGFTPGSAVSNMGPWPQWTFQQYDWYGRVAGIGGGTADVDLDAFSGTLGDLAAWRIPVITHTFTSAAPSPATAAPGNTVTLNATIQSTVARKLLLGASLFPPGASSGGTSDSAHDGIIVLTHGNAAVSRSFTIPANLPAGPYDLWLALYNDINNNGKIDAGDMAFGTVYKTLKALTISPPSGFGMWAASQGLSGDSASPTADADGDGADNLSEYAFSTLPLSAASRPSARLALLPASDSGAAPEVVFSFERAANRPDLVWSVEISPDLTHWTEVQSVRGDAPFTGPGWSSSPGDPALVTLTLSPYAAGPTFLRVKVVKS